jgi:hypothetical protein
MKKFLDEIFWISIVIIYVVAGFLYLHKTGNLPLKEERIEKFFFCLGCLTFIGFYLFGWSIKIFINNLISKGNFKWFRKISKLIPFVLLPLLFAGCENEKDLAKYNVRCRVEVVKRDGLVDTINHEKSMYLRSPDVKLRYSGSNNLFLNFPACRMQ